MVKGHVCTCDLTQTLDIPPTEFPFNSRGSELLQLKCAYHEHKRWKLSQYQQTHRPLAFFGGTLELIVECNICKLGCIGESAFLFSKSECF